MRRGISPKNLRNTKREFRLRISKQIKNHKQKHNRMEQSFLTAMHEEQHLSDNVAYTQNGARSYATTATISEKGGLLDYLFKALRSTPDSELRRLWLQAKLEDENAAGLLAFFKRDRFKGQQEKKPFREMLIFEVENGGLEKVIRWMPLIAYFGYAKDLLCLAGTQAEQAMLEFYCAVLLEDQRRMKNSQSVTTFAKFAPTEGLAFDKKHKLVGKMCNIIAKLENVAVFSKKNYRTLLSSLRSYTRVPERDMCLGLWDSIDFKAVPSRCMKNNKKAFALHSPELWSEYIKALSEGKTKVNSALFPHDLAHEILTSYSNEVDQVSEAQWRTMQEKARKEFQEFDMNGVLVMCDTSGSMTSAISKDTKVRCLDASLGLGLFFAELLPEPWKNCILTFSSRPEFRKASGNTLRERLTSIGQPIVENTNLQAALSLVLDTAVRRKVPRKDMPSVLLIISDMQFDPSGSYTTTPFASREDSNLEAMVKKYKASVAPDGLPYAMPTIVYWNVQGATSDFPATAGDKNVVMLSGFSPNILRLVFTGTLDPVQVLRRAIADPRYDPVVQTTPVDWKTFLYQDFSKKSTEDSDDAGEMEQVTKKVKVVTL